jgi:ABC-type dipeptide/oligopeptide/nickel transport system ATPase component
METMMRGSYEGNRPAPTSDRQAAGERTAPLLEISDLSVLLPTGEKSSTQAVSCVNLTIGAGERVGIVGESGSGKSVTGRTIAGLLAESKRVEVKGSIKFRGVEYNGAPRERWMHVRREVVSMIFQDPLNSLNPTMRVGRQVAEVTRPSLSQDDVAAFLEKAGLPNGLAVASRYPFELSGGMRQRVSIAIALAKRPSLVIADEPTTALDVTVQAKVLQSLQEAVKDLGTSLLMISHDLAVVAKMCDRVYVMNQGRVVESGDTLSVFTDPQHPYTAGLLSNIRRLSTRDTTTTSTVVDMRKL